MQHIELFLQAKMLPESLFQTFPVAAICNHRNTGWIRDLPKGEADGKYPLKYSLHSRIKQPKKQPGKAGTAAPEFIA